MLILHQELISQSAVVVCQMEVPLATTLAALRTAKGVRIFNAAPATKSLPAELYSLCKHYWSDYRRGIRNLYKIYNINSFRANVYSIPLLGNISNPLPLLGDIFCVNESEAQTLLGVVVSTLDDARVATGTT